MEDALKFGRIRYTVRKELFHVHNKLSQFRLRRTILEANENSVSDGTHYVVEVPNIVHTCVQDKVCSWTLI